MAITAQLVIGGDFVSDVKTLNLINSTSGFVLQHNGYAPGMAREGVVTDVMTVKVSGTSQDDVATKLQTLEEYFQRAQWASDGAERYQTWLRMKMTNETGQRQSLVLGGLHGDKAGFYSHPGANRNDVANYPIVIDRAPWWENVNSTSQTLGSIPSVGGLHVVTAVAGDVPARIGHTSLDGVSAVELTEFWWGFRTDRYGTATNFVSPWECEVGTPGTDTSATTDATASPGSGNSKMLCTFATNTGMVSRVSLTPYLITNANFADLRGTFNIVARMKVDTGFSVRGRLVSGIGTALIYNDAISVTSTEWKFYDLGRLTLPAGGSASSGYSAMRNSAIRLDAQWIAGTLEAGHGLHMDCLVAIPVDEGYAHISGGTGALNALLIDARGRMVCFDYGVYITGLADTVGTNAKDYTLPLGAGIIVVAAQRSAGSTLADAADITLDYFPRWRTLRGAA